LCEVLLKIHQPVGPQIHRLLVSSHCMCCYSWHNGWASRPTDDEQQILVMVPVVTQGIPSTSITYSHLHFKFPLINRADFEAESCSVKLSTLCPLQGVCMIFEKAI
jgi:hypothetical protein